MGQWLYLNYGHGFVLPHDLQISSSQLPAGTGARLGFGIGAHLGEINCAHTRTIFPTNLPLPSPLVRALHACCRWLRTRDILQGPAYIASTVKYKNLYIGINSRYFGVKRRVGQKSYRNRKAKVTNIYYNTVAPFYIQRLESKIGLIIISHFLHHLISSFL